VNPRFTFWQVDGIPVRVDEAQPALFDEAFDLLAPPRLVPAGDAKRHGRQISEAEWWTLVSHLRGRYRPDVAGTRYSFWAYKDHLPIRYDTVSGAAEAFHDWPPVPLNRLPPWSTLVRVSEAEFWARTARARAFKLLRSTAEHE
jgi:hypothetical protein